MGRMQATGRNDSPPLLYDNIIVRVEGGRSFAANTPRGLPRGTIYCPGSLALLKTRNDRVGSARPVLLRNVQALARDRNVCLPCRMPLAMFE